MPNALRFPRFRLSMRLYVCSAVAALLVKADLQSIYYGSINTQDELPPCSVVTKCNGQFCGDVCEEGTVVVDPQYQSSLAFQRSLQADRPLYAYQMVGTHNGFISRANGMGLTEDFASWLFARTQRMNASTVRVANQRYGVTDLLNMGVRHLETDIWATDVLFGEPHICHSPVIDPLYGVALQLSADALGLNASLQYDGFLELCSNISLVSAATRVLTWLQAPGNSGEVVGMFLDNRVPTASIERVTAALTSVFGTLMFTPMDLAQRFGGVWPSVSALLAAGKRVFVESNVYSPNNYTGTNFTRWVFHPTMWDALQRDPSALTPFPNCTIHGDASWYGASFVRMLEGSVVWFPDYDERQSGVAFKPNGYADMLACGAGNVAVADFGPHVLPGLVWTWLAGEPRASAANCSAAAMTTIRGRWSAQPCTRMMRALCRRGAATVPAGANPAAWALSAPVPFSAAPAACASQGGNWTFDLPRDGRENALAASMALQAGVWLPGAAAGGGIWLAHAL